MLSSMENSRRSRKGRAVPVVGIATALLIIFFQLSGAAAGPMAACAAMWKDYMVKPASEEQKTVRYNVGYSKEEGVVVQKLEETPVKVKVDGAAVITTAAMPRLDDILQEAGVELGENDRAEAKIDTESGNIPEIEVIRVRSRTVTEEETIPFTEKRIADQSLPDGATQIRQAGQEGVRLKKFEVTTENGKVVRRKELSSDVVKEAQPQVVAFGGNNRGRGLPAAARGGSLDVQRVLEMTATAYTHTGDPTASGVMPYVGGVAVDPKVIPLGANLFVEGYGYAKAVDTGGLIKGSRIDLFLNTEKECYDWGRRQVKVYVLP